MPELAPELRQRVTHATTSLADAKRELAAVLGEVRREERRDKDMVSATLKDAFERLPAAKTALASLLATQD